jgi:hypothetical protein
VRVARNDAAPISAAAQGRDGNRRSDSLTILKQPIVEKPREQRSQCQADGIDEEDVQRRDHAAHLIGYEQLKR